MSTHFVTVSAWYTRISIQEPTLHLVPFTLLSTTTPISVGSVSVFLPFSFPQTSGSLSGIGGALSFLVTTVTQLMGLAAAGTLVYLEMKNMKSSKQVGNQLLQRATTTRFVKRHSCFSPENRTAVGFSRTTLPPSSRSTLWRNRTEAYARLRRLRAVRSSGNTSTVASAIHGRDVHGAYPPSIESPNNC